MYDQSNKEIMFAWYNLIIIYIYFIILKSCLAADISLYGLNRSFQYHTIFIFYFPNWLEKRKWMTHHPSQTDPERRSSNTSI